MKTYKNKKLIGIDLFIYEFTDWFQMQKFLRRNKFKMQMQQIFIENSYGLECKKLRKIY